MVRCYATFSLPYSDAYDIHDMILEMDIQESANGYNCLPFESGKHKTYKIR